VTFSLNRWWVGLLLILLWPVKSWGTVTFDYSLVGDPGNAAASNGFGAVAGSFYLSKTEVTNAQYAEYLNHIRPNGRLPDDGSTYYPPESANVSGQGVTGILEQPGNPVGAKWVVKPGHENKPVVYVSVKAAARFVNWLSNGQGSGATETGVYTLTSSPLSRAAGAKVFLPSANEWFKAAYYKGGGTNAGYWTYANASDTIPVSAPAGAINGANYFNDDGLANGVNDGFAVTGVANVLDINVDYLTNVGAYSTTVGPYGHFDLIGNAGEWTETYQNPDYINAGHGFADSPGSITRASFPALAGSNGEDSYSSIGFRIAIAVPEPSAGLLALGLVIWRGRRRT
jgi:sulfatase modifying factor 1